MGGKVIKRSMEKLERKGMAVRWQGVVIALLLALVAFVVLNVCSYWNNGESGSLDFDQTIFYLIGRAWYEGHLPYVDV